MNEYEIIEPKRQIKSMVQLGLAVLVVVCLIVIVYYTTKVNKPKTFESHPISFSIAKGLRSKQIAYALEDAKVINSPTVFLIYSTLHQAGNKFEAGDYALNSNMTIPEIVDALTHGRVVSNDRSFTIIEGWSNSQIEKYLKDQGVMTPTDSLSNLLSTNNFSFKFKDVAKGFGYQGFLFPDTYKLSQSGSAVDLVQKLLTNFESKLTDQMLADIQSQHEDLGQVIILASIVEKEVGRNKDTLTADDLAALQKERELVASVFYNRLKIGMPLESDATVNYVTGKFDRSPLLTDTRVKSPYNTYINKGLPPSPISNPGLGSILAAINPAKSDYLYFLSAPDGTAYFAKTLAEHNANRVKYLK